MRVTNDIAASALTESRSGYIILAEHERGLEAGSITSHASRFVPVVSGPSLRMLGLVVKSVPGIIIVGREHVPGLETADEVVMAVEVPVAVVLNEPGATAGATSHIAGDGDHRATAMLPACAKRTLTGLPGLAIEGMPGGVAISIEGLINSLIIGPTGAANYVGQDTLAIGRNDGHAKVMMIVIWPGIYPVGRDLQITSGPTAIRRTAILVQWAENHVLYPVPIPVEAVASRVNNTLVEACDGSTRADVVLTRIARKKDFPNSREGINRVSIARGLPLLLNRLTLAGVDAPLWKRGSIVDLLIGVDGIAHARHGPMFDDDVGVRIHRVLNDCLQTS
jgi:hypothetical protein